MFSGLAAWFLRIALPLVLNWLKGLILEGIALLVLAFKRNKLDDKIDETNEKAADKVEEANGGTDADAVDDAIDGQLG